LRFKKLSRVAIILCGRDVKTKEKDMMGEKNVDWFFDEIVNGIRNEKTTI
jgi:hypothetical protein